MKRTRIVLPFIMLLSMATSYANAAIDDNAAIVQLRKDCVSLDNCFTTMGNLIDWIANTRTPSTSATAPLVIKAGPGEFVEFDCDGFSYVSLHGSGRGITTISGGSNPDAPGAVSAQGCGKLSFSDITIDGKGGIGVWWVDSGGSIFDNVEIINSSNAIYDYCLGSGTPVVKWYNSTIGPSSSSTIKATCLQQWFLASEIIQKWSTGGSNRQPKATISILPPFFAGNKSADLRFYGSSIRTTVASTVSSGKIITIDNRSGTFHSHGGEIVTNASSGTGNINVIAVRSGVGATKTNIIETSYGLFPGGTGIATRIESSYQDVVDAPFSWPSNANPPQIVSIDGFDSFIETDCDTNGNCDNGGLVPQLMIYNQAFCGSGNPWFNVATNQCRN